MKTEQLVKDLRNLGWREYKKALSQAIENKIILSDEDLMFAIVEIPEHYKITALVNYTNNVKPISQSTYQSIIKAIQESDNESYKNHLLEKFSGVKVE